MAGRARQLLGTEILTNRLNLLLTASMRDAGSWTPVLVRNRDGCRHPSQEQGQACLGYLGAGLQESRNRGQAHQSSVSTCHHRSTGLLNLVIRYSWSSSRQQGLSRCGVRGRNQNLPLWRFYLVGERTEHHAACLLTKTSFVYGRGNEQRERTGPGSYGM